MKTQTKTVMLIIDGVGDVPYELLGGKTPLEAAHAPHMHYLATRGEVGTVRTAFDGFPIESMVCIMGLLGYEPAKFYPSGRAAFEAMAKGIPIAPGDLILRCNTISVDRERQTISDFTAGLIKDSDARALISHIALPKPSWLLYPGQSYRNTLVVRQAGVSPASIRCFEPHMHIGANVRDVLPRALTPDAEPLVAELAAFLLDSQEQIAALPARYGAANMLWLWSPSKKAVWPTFEERTGMRGAVVGGLDFLHGIAMAASMHFDVIPGATGYIDTDYRAKADYTIRYLEDHDFVLTHVNAADEEAHQRNVRGKVDAIEKVDRLVLGPVLDHLRRAYGDAFRIVVCGDHETRASDGKHGGTPVPYALYGTGVAPSGANGFGERACLDGTARGSLDFLAAVRGA